MTAEIISVASLSQVPETLLIPLVARAIAPDLNPDLGFFDPIAKAIVDRTDAGPDRFTRDRATMRGCIVRAQWFDRIAADFLHRHPNGLCVSLGSGLDVRAHRIGLSVSKGAEWVDVDFAEVVELRRRLIPPLAGAISLVADLNQPGWIDGLPWTPLRPALFLSEGVMIYFTPIQAEELIRRLCAAADKRNARIELAFDYVSPLMMRRSHHHLAVGKTRARFAWPLKRPTDLLPLDPKLKFLDEVDIASRSGPAAGIISLAHRALTYGRRVYAAAHFERDPDRERTSN